MHAASQIQNLHDTPGPASNRQGIRSGKGTFAADRGSTSICEICIHLSDLSVEARAAICLDREAGHSAPKSRVRQIRLHRVKGRLSPGKARAKHPVDMQQRLAVMRENPSTL